MSASALPEGASGSLLSTASEMIGLLSRSAGKKKSIAKALKEHSARARVGNLSPTDITSDIHNIGRLFLDALGFPSASGVTVFFQPGTEVHLPVFYGSWQDLPITASQMAERIAELEVLLRHNQFPTYGLPRCLDSTSEIVEEVDHFFLLAKSYADMLPRLAGIQTQARLLGGKCGFCGASVWAIPSASRMELCLPTHPAVTVIWTPSISYPFLIGSLIHFTDKSIALTATFIGHNLEDPDERTKVVQLHETAAHLVFGPLYHAVLAEKTDSLSERFERNRISKRLLDHIAREIHTDGVPKHNKSAPDQPPQNRAFTYHWRDGARTLNIADLRAHLCDDVVEHPDHLIDRVVDLQAQIYHTMLNGELWKEYHDARETLSLKGLDFSRIPQNLPLLHTLKNTEKAQRALLTEDRDHLVHQLQVFALGVLFINRHRDSFLLSFSKTLDAHHPMSQQKVSKTSFSESEVEYLLQISWFLAALYHDVGRPGSLINDVVDAFRADVANLFHLPQEDFKNKKHVPVLVIDPVFFSKDPQAFLLFEKVVASLLGHDAKQDVLLRWRHLLPYHAFRNKDHAFLGMLALGLEFLHANSSKLGAGDHWLSDPVLDLLCHHVLVPILTHHANEWRMSGAGEHELTEMLCFESHPLACLLAFCDVVQEPERPSGQDAEKSPPPVVRDNYCVCKENRSVVRLELEFRDDVSIEKAAEWLQWKRNEIKAVYNTFDRRIFLEKTCVHVQGIHKNRSMLPWSEIPICGATDATCQARCPMAKEIIK